MRMVEFFEERKLNGQPLVLVTVFETAGSTYSKAGAQMLIDGDGHYCGMLSGGCLEGDLVERARSVIGTGNSETATYDLSADDELWGLGVGCDGTMHVLLQRLSPETDYEPFSAIANILSGDEPASLAIVVGAEASSINTGASVLLQDGRELAFGMSDAVARSIANSVDNKRPASDASSGYAGRQLRCALRAHRTAASAAYPRRRPRFGTCRQDCVGAWVALHGYRSSAGVL